MKIFVVLLSLFLLSLPASFAQEQTQETYCKQYLEWQLSNAKESLLEESVARVHKKLELAFLAAYSNSKGLRLKNNDEFIRLSDSLKLIDEDFSPFLEKHFQYRFFKRFYKKRFSPEKNLSIHDLVYRWQMFQKNNPDLFKGLNQSEFIDEWDLFAADSIHQMQSLDLKERVNYQEMINDFSQPESLIENNQEDFEKSFQKAQNSFSTNEEKFHHNFQEIISDSLNDYQNICPKKIELEKTALACFSNQETSAPHLKKELLSDLALVFNEVGNGAPMPIKEEPLPVIISKTEPTPKDPLEDIIIETPNYRTNDEIATFCKRDPNVADTIVIHHTATNYHSSAQDLNYMHLQRKTGNEHWYMLGYNFLVKQENYDNDSSITLIQGRPIDMSGSHAGGSIKPSKETLKVINETDVSCGSYKNGFKTNKLSSKINGGKINANHTTVGVSIIGNYSPKKYVRRGGVVVLENETGYDPKGPKRYPTEKILKETAKLACSLQKKYPRLKHIKPHQFFKATDCPGSVKERLNKIIQYAKEFSCDFLP